MTAPPAITLRFDAGTLLLDGFVEGASEGATLHGCVWDPRVRRYRVSAWRYRELVTALTRMARAGTLSFSEAHRESNAAPSRAWIPLQLPEHPMYEVRVFLRRRAELPASSVAHRFTQPDRAAIAEGDPRREDGVKPAARLRW